MTPPPSGLPEKVKWRDSFRGYFLYKYYAMKTRCRKIADGPYQGMEVMSSSQWDEFLAKTTKIRKHLFKEWIKNGRTKRYSPSIDRINPKLGYTPSNCRWVPTYVNWSKGGSHRRSPDKEKMRLKAAESALICFHAIPEKLWTSQIRNAVMRWRKLSE